jgi:hypothetical protein
MTQDAEGMDMLYRAALETKGIEYPQQIVP